MSNISAFNNIIRKQMPYALSKAINDSAFEVRIELQKEMRNVFDRPNNWTLNSVQVIKATKTNLEAIVRLRDDMVKGTSAGRYLRPQIFGGQRRSKGSEVWLRSKGILPAGNYIVPGKGAELDQYGNIKRSTMTKIFSALGAHSEVGFTANTTARSKKRNKKSFNLFVIKKNQYKKGQLFAGIWQRNGNRHVKPLIKFIVDEPDYQIRFKFREIATNKFLKVFEKNLDQALTIAIKTAR